MHSVDMIFKTVLIIGVLCFFVDLSSSRKLKVIGGYDIDIKDIPYHVSIQIKADADKPRFSFCGGTILDKNLIITAGHCITNVRNNNPENFQISVATGSNIYNRDGEVRFAEGFKVHPMYGNRSEDDSDFAIIKVEPEIEFNEYQSPVKLPSSDEKLPSGHELIIAGFGPKEDGVPRHLKAIKLPKFNKEECVKFYRPGEVTDRMMCAGFAKPEDNLKKRIGPGDSGGGLVSTTYGTLHGVACMGHEDAPSVFGRVVSVLPWIRRVMKGEVDWDH